MHFIAPENAMPTPTTRKFPRTMQQAFPRDAQWAYPIERTDRTANWLEIIAGWCITCVLIFMFVFSLVYWAAE